MDMHCTDPRRCRTACASLPPPHVRDAERHERGRAKPPERKAGAAAAARGAGGALAWAARRLNPAGRIPPSLQPAAAAASRQARCPVSTDPHGRRARRLIGLHNYWHGQHYLRAGRDPPARWPIRCGARRRTVTCGFACQAMNARSAVDEMRPPPRWPVATPPRTAARSRTPGTLASFRAGRQFPGRRPEIIFRTAVVRALVQRNAQRPGSPRGSRGIRTSLAGGSAAMYYRCTIQILAAAKDGNPGSGTGASGGSGRGGRSRKGLIRRHGRTARPGRLPGRPASPVWHRVRRPGTAAAGGLRS